LYIKDINISLVLVIACGNMILSAAVMKGQADEKPRLPDPATDRLKPTRTDLQRLRELFSLSGERQVRVSTSTEGWTGNSAKISKSVPTTKAYAHYEDAMKLAKRLIDDSDEPGFLNELRIILMTNPMQDTWDQRYRDQLPPLVDELDARRAITEKA
jgi:hypothetical protein